MRDAFQDRAVDETPVLEAMRMYIGMNETNLIRTARERNAESDPQIMAINSAGGFQSMANSISKYKFMIAYLDS